MLNDVLNVLQVSVSICKKIIDTTVISLMLLALEPLITTSVPLIYFPFSNFEYFFAGIFLLFDI